jgi:hypothetical protein
MANRLQSMSGVVLDPLNRVANGFGTELSQKYCEPCYDPIRKSEGKSCYIVGMDI